MKNMVSVIVPVYKGQKYIQPIIEMISKWNKKKEYEIELLFVNDFPDSPLYLPENVAEYPISCRVLENEKNMGIHCSKINGIGAAKGEYIVFLDQDDTLHEDYLESQFGGMTENEAIFCNGLYRKNEKIYSATNPMKEKYSMDDYVQEGYPLISLGQLLIRKDKIPQEWLSNPMIFNGWDDHYLWLLLMIHDVKVQSNSDVLYIHEEDGSNASFNWKQMIKSGENLKENMMALNLLTEYQEKRFIQMVDERLNKYEQYDELETILKKIDLEKLSAYFKNENITEVAIYGYGIFGRAFHEMLNKININMKYAIDRRKDIKTDDIRIISLDDDMEYVDIIVVTTLFCYEDVKADILEKTTIPIISLKELAEKGYSL